MKVTSALLLSLLPIVRASVINETFYLNMTYDDRNSSDGNLTEIYNITEVEDVCSFLEEWGILLENVDYQESTDAAICACAAGATNHGSFVSCVVKLAQELWKDGILTKDEAQDIRVSAAQSDIGKDVGGNSTSVDSGDSEDSEDYSNVTYVNVTYVNVTATVETLPSDFIQEESGIELSAEAIAAFDACAEGATNWGNFNSCAQKVMNDLRKSGEVSKNDAKLLKSAVAAYKDTFLASLEEEPVPEDTTEIPPVSDVIEDTTDLKLSKKEAKSLDECLALAADWGTFNSCAKIVVNKMKKSMDKAEWKQLKKGIKAFKSIYEDATAESEEDMETSNSTTVDSGDDEEDDKKDKKEKDKKGKKPKTI